MSKLWATLKYGSSRTKTFIIMVFVLLVGGLLLSVLGIVNYVLWQLGVGVVCLIAGLVMIFMANFSTESIDTDNAEADDEEADEKDLAGNVNAGLGVKDRKRSGNNAGNRRSYDKKDLRDNKKEIAEDEDIILDDEDEVEEFNGRNTYRAQQPVMVDVSKYSEAEYRRTLKRYKVKRQFTSIIIDECRSFNTAHTPALVWVKKNVVNFLLLEGNERVCTMPLESFLNVRYERDVQEDNAEAYDAIRNEMGVYEKFADVMPQFTSTANRLGKVTYTRNRYILGRDLAITPGSLRVLREKFKFRVNIFDALKLEGEYSMYFKKAYEARILWTDTVIGQVEYQNRISNILQSMVDDRQLIRYDFLDDLERMVQYRLITSEYADYYNAQRQKRDNTKSKN